jgi:hypothetical protein
VGIGAEIGGYTLSELLGSGGLGLVYLGARGDEQAAIKLGHEHGGSRFMTRLLGATHARGLRGDVELASFSKEDVDAVLCAEGDVLERAGGAAGLPKLLGRAEHEGRPVLIEELVPGRTLLELRVAGEPLPLASVSALARALATAIRAGSLPAHGELKLSNLLLHDGRLRPIDPRPSADPSVASPAYYPLLRHDPSADAVALAGCLQAYASGKEPFGEVPAPARAREGHRVSLKGFLAQHPAPEDLPDPLSGVLAEYLGVASLLAAPAVERLEQLADALDALELDLVPAAPPVAPPGGGIGPPGDAK